MKLNRDEILAEARTQPCGLDWSARLTTLADGVVSSVFQGSVPNGLAMPAIIATGSYGRRDPGPFSDLDIAVIPSDESDPELERFLHDFHQRLVRGVEENLGVKLDYAIRSEAELPALDPKSRTSLIEARFVVGDPAVLEKLQLALWESFPIGEFIVDKLMERAQQMASTNATPLAAEPNLKDGAGGMRCFNASNWIRSAIGERPKPPTAEYETILKIRNSLHALTGRPSETLARTKLGDVASIHNLTIDQLTEGIGLALSAGHRRWLETVNHLRSASYTLRPGASTLLGDLRISPDCRLGDAALGVALANSIGLRLLPNLSPKSREIEAGEVLSVLSAGESVLRSLDQSGILKSILPELDRCRTLVPPDASHAYTVFEHTLQAIGVLDRLPTRGFWSEVLFATGRPDLLYVATLLHDIGKADPTGPHSERGAHLVLEIARRWNLSDHDRDLIEWLVAEHLSLARLLRIRDVHHPSTASELAQLVGTMERLNLLTLLTYADIAAVHPGAWTPMYDAQMADLYRATANLLEHDFPEPEVAGATRRRLIRELRGTEATPEEVEAFLTLLPASYVPGSTVESIRLHMRYVRDAQEGKPVIEAIPRPDIQASEITVVWPDKPGTLSHILGVLYAYDMQVHSLKASTTLGENPVVVDTLSVSFSGRPMPPAVERHMIADLRTVLAGQCPLSEILIKRGKDPARRQRDYSHRYHPGTPGILEVHAPKGKGMAFRLSQLIADRGWNILSSKVGQWGGHGAASFYIEKPDGSRITKEEVEEALRPEV